MAIFQAKRLGHSSIVVMVGDRDLFAFTEVIAASIRPKLLDLAGKTVHLSGTLQSI